MLFEILNLYSLYIGHCFEKHYSHIVTCYLEVLLQCKVYIKDFSEKILEKIFEILRIKPICLDILKNHLHLLPEFIKDYAK